MLETPTQSKAILKSFSLFLVRISFGCLGHHSRLGSDYEWRRVMQQDWRGSFDLCNNQPQMDKNVASLSVFM